MRDSCHPVFELVMQTELLASTSPVVHPQPTVGPGAASWLDRGKQIQELIDRARNHDDPQTRELLNECLQTVLALYGDGLARVIELARNCTATSPGFLEQLLADDLVRGLLLVHDLHPVPLETRLRTALSRILPYIKSHGGNVELLKLENNYAWLRLDGTCKTCPSSAVTMELAIRGAIEEACPDLAGFEVEGVATAADGQLAEARATEWVSLNKADDLPESGFVAIEAAGVPVVICKLNDQLYAYRDHCPACNLPLRQGAMTNGLFLCREGHAYDVRQAGQCRNGSQRALTPFPLLVENGQVKVAVR